MKLLLVETFYKGSHKSWSKELRYHLKHNSNMDLDIMSFDNLSWKEAMLYDFKEDSIEAKDYDLVIVSSMVDLIKFKSKFNLESKHIIYFHENQLSYPWTKNGNNNRKEDFSSIQYKGAEIADWLIFNSRYNLNTFGSFKEKSSIIQPGLNVTEIQSYKRDKNQEFTILWNHRWEYDKNPKVFFDVLSDLQQSINFKLIVTGESPEHVENLVFKDAREKFKNEIIHFGYAESKEDYYKLLWSSHVSIVTSHHDFFGLSVCESALCDVINILPNRLAYPEHFKTDKYFYCEYKDIINLVYKVKDEKSEQLNYIKDYDWKKMIFKYIEVFKKIGQA